MSCRRHLGCATSDPSATRRPVPPFRLLRCLGSPVAHPCLTHCNYNTFPSRKVFTLCYLRHNLLSFPMTLVYLLVYRVSCFPSLRRFLYDVLPDTLLSGTFARGGKRVVKGLRWGADQITTSLTLLLQGQQTKRFRHLAVFPPASLLSPLFISVSFDPHNSSESEGQYCFLHATDEGHETHKGKVSC